MITLDEQIEYMRDEVSFWIDRLPSTYEKCKAILSTLEKVRDEQKGAKCIQVVPS